MHEHHLAFEICGDTASRSQLRVTAGRLKIPAYSDICPPDGILVGQLLRV